MTKNRLGWIGAGILVLLIGSLYLPWTSTPELAGLGGDNATYLLTAQHYSPWLPASEVARFFAQHSQYPPLLPLLFAFSGGAADVQTAHLVIALTFILSLIVMARWVWLSGASWGPALTLPTAFALMPGTLVHVVTINSEVLYLLLSFCALVALGPGQGLAAVSRRRMLWVLITVALGLLTRSAGFALVGSALIFMCWQRRFRATVFLSLALVPALGWRWLGGQTRESYFASWLELGTSPAQEFSIDRLAMLANIVADAWKHHLFGPLSGGAAVAVGLLFVALAGAILRARRGSADGFYTLAYGAMVLVWGFIWPATVARLLFPIVPILLFQAYWGLAEISVRFTTVKAARVLPALLIVTCIIGAAPNANFTGQRFTTPLPDRLARFKQSRLWYVQDERLARVLLENYAAVVSGLREIEREVEPGECIYAVKPSIVGWYAGRASRLPPRERFDEPQFWAQIRAGGCRYVIGMNGRTPSFSIPFYPMPRMVNEVEVVRVWRAVDGSRPLLVLSRLQASEAGG